MISLGSANWGSSPVIPIAFAYEKKRSGADMQYRVQVTIASITGTHYFGYPIYLDVTIGGTSLGAVTMKTANPARWESAITYTSGWHTVSNKTSGTTSVSFKMYSGSGSTRNNTYTYSMEVDPAASTVSASNGTLATALSLNVTRYNTGFTHAIVYYCGDAAGTVCDKTTASTITWNTTNGNVLALALQNTTGQTVNVKFTIITYNGTDVVGTSSTTVVMTIPDTVRPSVSVKVEDAAGYFSTYGAYVQGWSKLKITATPTLAHNSPISTYAITADGKSYNTSPVTTGAVQGKGTLPVTAKVTDARTHSSELTSVDITVLEYSKPAVQVIAYRCNSSGVADPEGAHMRVGFTASIANLNGKNTASYTINYGGTPITGTGTSYTSAPIACDVSQVISVEVTVSDKFDSTTKAAVIPIAFTLMDFHNSGEGVTLGKVATRKGFDCAMYAYFCNNRVQEVGTPVDGTDAVNLSYVLSAFAPAIADTTYPNCYYRMVDGSKEWINPPMRSGVEYRTTERWMGKPVYTKIIPFGTLPNATAMNKSWSPDSGMAAQVISAVAISNSGGMLNLIDSANTSSIWIVTNDDYSSQTADVVLKYTKV